MDLAKEQQRAELPKTICQIAPDLRPAIDVAAYDIERK